MEADRARHFYTDILGLNKVKSQNFLIKGIYYESGDSILHIIINKDPKIPHIHLANETKPCYITRRGALLTSAVTRSLCIISDNNVLANSDASLTSVTS